MHSDPKQDVNPNLDQLAGRRMVLSSNSVQIDELSPSKQTQGLDDSLVVDPDVLGTQVLTTIIEQRRQVADIYSAIRSLRGGIISQDIGGYSSTTAADPQQPPKRVSQSSRPTLGATELTKVNMQAM